MSGQEPSTSAVNEGKRQAAFDTLKNLVDLFKKGIFDILILGFNGYLEVGENEFKELVEGYSSSSKEEEERPLGESAPIVGQYFYEISGEGTGAKISKVLRLRYTIIRRPDIKTYATHGAIGFTKGFLKSGIKTYAIYGVAGITKPEGTGLSEKISPRTRMILDTALNDLVSLFHEDVYDGFSLYFNRYFNAYDTEREDLIREYKGSQGFIVKIDDKEVRVDEFYYDIGLLMAPNKYTLRFRTLTLAYHIEENPENPISPFFAIHYIRGRTWEFEKETS